MLIALFDKSSIHGITVDEAAVFDMHFMSNITPLFFVEVLADLEKKDVAADDKRTSLVKSLAAKTPDQHSYPNVPHVELAINELLGRPVTMDGRPHVGGGRRVQNEKGLGTIFEEPPEMRAKNRWHDGKFEEEEYKLAKDWRDMLAQNPAAMQKLIKGNASRFTFQNHAAIKAKVDELIDKSARLASLQAAMASAHLPSHLYGQVLQRWKEAGGPTLKEFAPYSAHILAVDLFKVLAMSSDFMSPDKTSNYVDIAYLYYLPFCQVFISTDKLHRHCAPLFVRTNQEFIWGPDLRKELAVLVDEYLAAPDLNEVGLMGVAGRKTFSAGTFLGDLYQKFHPGKNMGERDLSSKLSPEAEAKLVAELRRQIDEAGPPSPDADLSAEDKQMTFKRVIKKTKGRFQVLPRRVIEKDE